MTTLDQDDQNDIRHEGYLPERLLRGATMSATRTRDRTNGHSPGQPWIPPSSIEAEKGIVGAILDTPDEAFLRLGESLSPAAFSHVDLGKLYRAAQQLHTDGIPVTVITLADAVRGELDGDDDHCGRLLNECMDCISSYSNLLPNARIITDNYRLRILALGVRQLEASVFGSRADADEIVDSLHRLSESVGRSARSMKLTIRVAGESIALDPTLHRPVIEGQLRIGETMNIIAPSKARKSWLVMQIGLSVATGRKVFDTHHTYRGRVLMIDNELHAATFDTRLRSVAYAMELQPEDYQGRLHNICLRGNLMDLPTLCGELDKLQHGEYDLIVLDAWYRLIPSKFDENSNGDVTALYNVLDRTAGKIGCAFLLVHHASKGSQADKAVTDVGAGAGAQARAADSHLILRQHEVDDAVVVDAAVRSWAPIEPYVIRFTFPLWARDDALDPKSLRRFFQRRDGQPAAQTREDLKQQRDQASREKLLEAYRQFPNGETARMLRATTKLSGVKFPEINDQLIAEGLVQEFESKKGRQPVTMYRLIAVGQVGHDPLKPTRPSGSESGGSSVPFIRDADPTHLTHHSAPEPPKLDELPNLDGEYR